jgi:hypothetical protein
MHRSRRCLPAVIATVVVLVGVALTAYLVLPRPQTRDIAMPADDATPEQVVATYLDALDAHDCDTAAAIMSEDGDSARMWCEDILDLSDVEVRAHVREKPQWSGRSPTEDVVHVPVSFDLDWRPLLSDHSMAGGPTDWGYLLVRESPASPWRIFTQGMG